MKTSIANLLSDKREINSPVSLNVEKINNQYYICPASDEMKEIDQLRNQEEIMEDFLMLLSGIQKCLSTVYDWGALIERNERRRVDLFNVDIEKTDYAMKKCAELVAPFCEKWGRFGILWSNISPGSMEETRTANDGATVFYGDTQRLTVKKGRFSGFLMNGIFNDGLPHGNVEAKEYFSIFFPKRNDGTYPQERTHAFLQEYCEPIESIIFGEDFLSMLLHFIRRDSNDDFTITPPVISVQYEKQEYVMGWQYTSLIQMLTILYANNIIQHKIAVCAHCEQVFRPRTKTQRFCSTSCSDADRARRYRFNKKQREMAMGIKR